MKESPNAIWTVAGFDPSGGAGVLADVATFRVFQLDGVAAVTALTAQRPGRVAAVEPVTPAFLRLQLETLAEAFEPAYVKVGMVPDAALVDVIADFLAARPVTLVVDPVWRASAGPSLTSDAALTRVRERLLPRCSAITPNLAEAGALLGEAAPTDLDGAGRAATALASLLRPDGVAIVTGGHLEGDPVDTLGFRDRIERLASRRLPGDAHGTGCRFSAAVLAGLARQRSPADAVRFAQQVVLRYIAGGTFPA